MSGVLNLALICGVMSQLRVAHQLRRSAGDATLAQQNSLLVVQQLNELFARIDSKLAAESEMEKFEDLIRVFANYDSSFVDLNNGNRNTIAETAYAAHRSAKCWMLLGEPEESMGQLRTARKAMQRLCIDYPHLHDYQLELLEIQISIIDLEIERGDFQSARLEYKSAVRTLGELASPPETGSRISQRLTYIQHLKFLATQGIELRELPDAFTVASRLDESAQSLFSEHADVKEVIQEANDARAVLNALSILKEKQTP